MEEEKKEEKLDSFLAHELLDRLYLICDMYNDYICEHPSYELLSKEQRQKVRDLLWNQYQSVGTTISEIFGDIK